MPFLVSFVITVVAVLIAAILGLIAKDWLIIACGIRTFKLITGIALGIAVACLAVTIILGLLVLKGGWNKRREQRRQSQFISDYAEDADSPELTRKMLVKLQRSDASFNELVAQCTGQMDRMDELQAKQARLLEANGALYLRETEDTLNRVEQRICRNIRNIINLCIAAGTAEHLNYDKVSAALHDNQSKLADASELINVSVDRINKYITDHRDDSSEVRRWIETIRESLEEE